jgi:hypothetical protein
MKNYEIKICPDCNSSRVTYYDIKKRGGYLIIATIILFPLFVFILPRGFLSTVVCLLVVGIKGISMYFYGVSYYLCNDCLYCVDVNGKKLNK